ncbi:MAG: phage tail tape measure protein [Tannerella sp.]|jgi:TP901 family phage tail tape measure protein|nr:phage tail tape measure protein [Tannerella sp.]
MAQEQNYSVNYTINVEATQGTRQVMAFADAVGKLTQAKASLTPAVSNIRNMMADIDRAFRTKSGKKRDYSFKMNIDTKGTEEKLGRVKALLGEIREMSRGINLAINAGQALNSKTVKSRAKSLIDKKAQEINNAEAKKSAAASAQSIIDIRKRITGAVGKVNASLISLERGRQLNIKTDAAKGRLQEILSLLGRIKGSTSMSLNLKPATGRNTAARPVPAPVIPFTPVISSPLSEKARSKLQEKLYANEQLHRQRSAFRREEEAARLQQRNALEAARRMEGEQARIRKVQEDAAKKALAARQGAEREEARQRQLTAAAAIRNMQRRANMESSMYGSRRRAAVNRLQYSKAPTMQGMPFAYMFNAYMAYGMIRRQLTDAVEYANIMQTAHSILRVADTDLSTFESRFDKMARYVRRIGVETKFTAIEVAGAVKYLSMAGMNIETINHSIRPITNLALIGDNDISQIADLATNIMAGYDIKSSSMNSVADILASTVSRSNVNIIEVAESYKMAAGYMKLAGVEFSESSAAIGILGNMGVKGTMAGTALRAMATRFAKPPREAKKVLDRLNVKFTEYHDLYGKQVEKLRPLADIFEELQQKGATMADMQAIFGKIGGNAAMMFVRNSDKLRELTSKNKASQGISSELAKVKQDTTKGFWYQVTSQFSESFMQGYERLEPQIRSVLKDFLGKFKAPEFARGLASIGSALLDIVSVLSNIANWVIRNFNWIEPMLFTGIVATRLFKLAGAVTNLGVAFGFLGKQAALSSTMQTIGSLTGLAGMGRPGNMSFANKRAVVSALRAAGVTGRGSMVQALASYGMAGGANALLARSAAGGLFASQVSTGSGLVGAGASIAAIGTGAVAATAGIAALAGVMGWLAYKTWKVKQAKDAMQEEIKANEKYRYPSIEALYDSLNKTYRQAIDTKRAVDELTATKTLEEASGQKIGAFTGNWWTAALNSMGNGSMSAGGAYYNYAGRYSFSDAYQDNTRAAITTIARKDSQSRINSAYAEFGKLRNAWEVGAFIQNIQSRYGQADSSLDTSLWRVGAGGEVYYNRGMDEATELTATKTYDYAKYHNTVTVPEIRRAATAYQSAIGSYAGARGMMEKGGFNFGELEKRGFYQGNKGQWIQKALGKNATDKDRQEQLANFMAVHDSLVKFTSSLRNTMGGSAEAAENILRMAGFTPRLYSNEPDYNDEQPFNANGITASRNGQYDDADDGRAGGNYSGTGKLSSAAPKQVVVNITNLLSLEAINLLKSNPEGNTAEIQNLKEQLAQALIDVVHDFDASWGG